MTAHVDRPGPGGTITEVYPDMPTAAAREDELRRGGAGFVVAWEDEG